MEKISSYFKKLLTTNTFLIIGIIIVSVFLFTLTARGEIGNPTASEIENELSASGKPFETSQERSRYAIILSLINDGTVAIDNYASIGTPDIGIINGHYYSFFPPTVSILALPLFIWGSSLGIAQIMTFSISTIFSILTMIMIGIFILKLKLHWTVALFGALSFGFATNAWGYSVTLYAHLVSAFLIILGLYIVLLVDDNKKGLKAILAWILYGLAVFVDFPNLFLYLPIVGFAMLKVLDIKKIENKYTIKLSWLVLLSPLIFFVLMGGYGYYNYVNFGDPTKLSNTIPRVKDLNDVDKSIPESGSDATGALNTRNLLNGYQSFLISHDRGIIIYSPVVLLFIFGLGFLKKQKKWIETILLSIPALCITIYSMFGDPYAGWAFGSRYMIASFPALCILAAIGLQRFYKNIFIKLIYSAVFIYSAAIALLSPLTTNVIPPYVEAYHLGLDSWYIINWEMLLTNHLSSYFYNYVLNGSISGITYYSIILAITISLGLLTIWLRKKKYENN